MIISIVSPHERTGKTTTAILLAQAIGYTQNVSVLLISTEPSTTLPEYIGIEPEDDITSAIGQVVTLIEHNAITPEDIPDYCRRVSPNCTLLDTSTDKFSKDDMDKLVHTVATMSTSDVVIVECQKRPIADSDIVLHVLNEDTASIKMCQNNMEKFDDIVASQFYIIAKYNQKVIDLRSVSKDLGVKYRFMGKVHLSEVIEKECRKGTLDTMMPFIIQKEPSVIELNMDLKEIIQYIFSIMGQKIKWEG